MHRLDKDSPLPFDSLSILRFRGLQDLSLEKCKRVNILVGGNNSGKTSILEALLLLVAPRDPSGWRTAAALRGSWPLEDMDPFRALGELDGLRWLFTHRDGEMGEIEIRAQGANAVLALRASAQSLVGEPEAKSRVSATRHVEGLYRSRREGRPQQGLEIELRLEWNPNFVFGDAQLLLTQPPPEFTLLLWEGSRSPKNAAKTENRTKIAFASPVSHRSDSFLARQVSRLIRTDRKDHALELLRQVDDRVQDLNLLWPESEENAFPESPRAGAATLHVLFQGVGLIPIQGMGDGLRRAVHLACLLADLGRGGVLLLDELEVAMHSSVLEKVFQWLGSACKSSGVQLFATTHSLEAVDALLVNVPEEELALFRLEPGRARRYSGSLLKTARIEMGQEVR